MNEMDKFWRMDVLFLGGRISYMWVLEYLNKEFLYVFFWFFGFFFLGMYSIVKNQSEFEK